MGYRNYYNAALAAAPKKVFLPCVSLPRANFYENIFYNAFALNEPYCLIDYHCYPLYTVNGDNMNLLAYIKQQGISVYSLSKKSAVPYTTLCSICNGTADVMECRVNTLVKIADSLGVNLLDLINSSLVIPQKYNFINDEIRIEFTDLPKALKSTIKELEEYDRNNDTMFYECADMLYMMADRFLKDGAIDSETRDKLIMKYPIA